MITAQTIYGQCARMKRTNDEATLNNWKTDQTEMNSMEKGQQDIIKLVRGLQNRNYVVWSLRSITISTNMLSCSSSI